MGVEKMCRNTLDAPTSPQSDTNVDGETMMFHNRSPCCFWMPAACFGSNSNLSPSSSYASDVWWDRWWSRPWNKIRQWSEILAGPTWKTFIRSFNKTRKHDSFQYDPLSYALNFDDGIAEDDHEHLDFSTRFASIPASAKSSVYFGKDGPPVGS